LVDFDEHGGAETQQRGPVGEDAEVDGASLELLLDGALDRVRGAPAPAVMLWQGDD
jgi:hypothetical protein